MKEQQIHTGSLPQKVKCVKYLEKHGGRLTQSMTRTKWPDGTMTDFAWQYAAGEICVTGAKTAMDAIRQHIESAKRRRLSFKKK